jgi:hypothetical protein
LINTSVIGTYIDPWLINNERSEAEMPRTDIRNQNNDNVVSYIRDSQYIIDEMRRICRGAIRSREADLEKHSIT